MQSQFDRYSPFDSKWHVVSGEVHRLEAIASLKLRELAHFLIAECKFTVNQIRYASLAANLYGFGDESVHRALVVMASLGENLHYVRPVINIDELDEPDQFITEIGADEFTSIEGKFRSPF